MKSLIVKIELLLILLILSLEWDPKSLYEYYIKKYEDRSEKLIDPEGFVTDDLLIKSRIQEIEKLYNISLLFIVVKNVDVLYSLRLNYIKAFINDFTNLYYNYSKEIIKNSMTIAFSIYDRKMAIVAGQNVSKIFPEYYCTELLNFEKEELIDGKFDLAFNNILYNIIHFKEFKDLEDDDFWITAYIVIGLIIVGTIVYLFLRLYDPGKKEDITVKKLNHILERINNDRYKYNEILNEYCVFCLEEMNCWDEDNNLSSSDDSHNKITSNINYIEEEEDKKNMNDVEINLNENNLEEPLIEKNEKEENEIDKEQENSNLYRKTLSCGHHFHKKCINDWLLNQIDCPICLEGIDSYVTNEEFGKKIIKILEMKDPKIKQLNIEFNPNIDKFVSSKIRDSFGYATLTRTRGSSDNRNEFFSKNNSELSSKNNSRTNKRHSRKNFWK